MLRLNSSANPEDDVSALMSGQSGIARVSRMASNFMVAQKEVQRREKESLKTPTAKVLNLSRAARSFSMAGQENENRGNSSQGPARMVSHLIQRGQSSVETVTEENEKLLKM